MSTIANPTTHVFALAGVGNLIPQSIAGYIEDMAQESDTVRAKEVGTDVGILHTRPRLVMQSVKNPKKFKRVKKIKHGGVPWSAVLQSAV
jgi:hypothetical protein